MVLHGPAAIALCGLAWRRNHDLLPCGAPQGSARWPPGEMELVGIGQNLARLQAIAGRVDRLFFT
jgi:hypothetical protein